MIYPHATTRKLRLVQKEGAGVIPKLANDLKNEIPDVKGVSERNIKFMVQLYKEYTLESSIGKQPVSKLENIKNPIPC